MSTIPLYNALVKLGLDNDAARDAVDNVASTKGVSTKADIAELKAQMATLETRLIKWMIGIAFSMFAIGIAVIGLMIKFL